MRPILVTRVVLRRSGAAEQNGAREGDVVMVVQGIARVVDRITDQWDCVLWSRGVP